MTELLSIDRVVVGAAPATKADAIDLVGRMLVDAGIVADAYVAAMHDREAVVSTYLGNGIALPHGTNEAAGAILGTGLAVAQVPAGVTWDDEPARLVIGLAASGHDHIEMLSRLATVLEDADLCDRLAATGDASEIHAALVATPPDEAPPGPAPEGLTRSAAISNPSGLHARPAAQIVAGLRSLTADVTIATAERRADARSITGLLGLGASVGDHVTVVARGPDAERAMDTVMEIVLSGRDR